MTLYSKHRPAKLETVLGNEETIGSLKSVLERERKDIPHAFLFYGPSGCGKTTLARIVAQTLGCSEWEFKEVDSADFRGIDTIRDIRKQMNLKAMNSPCRVWLLDECHKLTNEAQNALLKALEDTPPHIYFLLATTEPQKLLKTIVNRCLPCPVTRLTKDFLLKLLRKTVSKEGKKVSLDVLERVAKECNGSPRSALVLLDKIIDMDAAEMSAAIKLLDSKEAQVIDLCRALYNREKWEKVRNILLALEEEEEDEEQIRQAVLGYFSKVLLGKFSPNAFLILDVFRHPFFDSGRAGLVMACYEVMDLKKETDRDIPL
jgi:DNA polymerase-3 subunit gamma/tau